MDCIHCSQGKVVKDGTQGGVQRYWCRNCGKKWQGDCRRSTERATCSECDKPHHALGLCSTHYRRWSRKQK
jgi:transposase-like protein